jgi:hypothetical protein
MENAQNIARRVVGLNEQATPLGKPLGLGSSPSENWGILLVPVLGAAGLVRAGEKKFAISRLACPRPLLSALLINLRHDPLCPWNGSNHHSPSARTVPGVEEVLGCLQVTSN